MLPVVPEIQVSGGVVPREAYASRSSAVNDEEDCHLQMLHMVLLRLLQPQFVDSESDGPFVLQFTDFHASNIFVDDAWNIVALIDLEFVCALPPCMLHVPHWLAVDAIDDIRDEMAVFSRMHRDFMAQFEDVETGTEREHSIPLSSSIREALSSGACWFYLCLTSINGMQCFLEDHLYEKFDVQLSADEERRWASLMSRFWSPDAKEVVARKLRDKAKYNDDMALHFARNSSRSPRDEALDLTVKALDISQ